jgi:hypothetical protein
MAYGVKRSRRKRAPQRIPAVRRRALEIIATHPDGSSEAILAAQNIRADVLSSCRAAWRPQGGSAWMRKDEFLEETTLWITAAGDCGAGGTVVAPVSKRRGFSFAR